MKMEGVMRKGISLMLVAVVLMGIFAEQSTAFSLKCYGKCMLSCVEKEPSNGTLACAIFCLKECMHPNDLQNQCNLGCATQSCARLSTPQNPAPKEMKGCVDSCSDQCNKKN